MAGDDAPAGGVGGGGGGDDAPAAAAAAWHNPAEAGAVIPWLSTDDMAGSLAFYVDALHFSTLFTANAAHVKRVPPDGYPRGGVALAMLRLGPAALLLQASSMVPPVIRGARRGAASTDRGADGAAVPTAATAESTAATAATGGATPCRGAGVSLYLLGLDPDGLLPGLPAGVRVLQPPVTQPSGMREAVIVDPVNGYVITVAKSMGPGGGGGVEMQRVADCTAGAVAGGRRGVC